MLRNIKTYPFSPQNTPQTLSLPRAELVTRPESGVWDRQPKVAFYFGEWGDRISGHQSNLPKWRPGVTPRAN
jgi:hypothetical protein